MSNAAAPSGNTDLAEEQIQHFANRVSEIREQLHRTVVGQDETLDLLLTCALTGSHALLVGVPGLAKTLMVKATIIHKYMKCGKTQQHSWTRNPDR